MTRSELQKLCLGRCDFVHPLLALDATVDGNVVSHVSCYAETLIVGGERIPVWGIAQVCTHPAYRNLGLARSLVRAAHLDGHGRGYSFAALFSDYQDFYAELGYGPTLSPPLLVKRLTGAPMPSGAISWETAW